MDRAMIMNGPLLRWGVFLSTWLWAVGAWAQAVTTSPEPWNPIGNIANLSVSNSSSNVILGWVAVTPDLPPAGVYVCNTGSNAAFVALGTTNSVTATTNNIQILAGSCRLLKLNKAQYMAAITSSSTTTLTAESGAGSPLAAGGAGSSTGGMLTNASNAVLPDALNNLGLGTGGAPQFSALGIGTAAGGAGSLTMTGQFRELLTTDTTWSTVFAGINNPMVVAQHGNQNSAIIGYFFNDLANSTNALPSGLIGYGNLKSSNTGNQVFGIYGLATNGTAAGTAIGAEFTCRNTGGAPDTALPPNESIGTPTIVCNGLQVTSGGTFDSSVGIQLSREGGSTVNFNTGQYIQDFTQYGLYINDNRGATGAALFVKGIIASTGFFHTTDATASTSSITGSIVTAGGIGVAGSSYFGGSTLSLANAALLGFTGNAAPTSTTYALYGDTTQTKVNVTTGGTGTLNVANSAVLTWATGVQIGAPTGGDKGTGTLNAATNIYVAGGTLTGTANALMTGGGTGTAPNFVAVTGLVLGNGASAPSAYGGATCTNQALTVLSAAGAPTCSSITNSFLTSGSFTNITGIGSLTTNAITSGYFSTTGTTLPSPAAGTLGVGGEAAVPTFAANGEAAMFITSTTGGISLMGKGSTNDFTLYNSGGTASLVLPTGTTIPSAPGFTVTGSSTPTNGVYLPAASTVGLVGATKIDLFSGASKVGDYNDTTASTWTLNAATTINNATFKVTTLGVSTAVDTVCYSSATGLFTEEPTGTTCTVSDERKKVGMLPISRRHSLEIVLASKPISYYYISELGDPDYHLGFGAQTLAKIAPELVQRDEEGVPNAVKQLELLPITWAAMQQMREEHELLRADIADLRRGLGMSKP